MLNSVLRVGFGFSNVTFRPSCVFHFRVFSYPTVLTRTEYWKLPAFVPNIQSVVTNFCADNVCICF